MSEWIKCSERMPEDGEQVLCWFTPLGKDKSHPTILYYKAEKESDRHSHFSPIREDLITHWMPLPEPPHDKP